MYDVCAQADGVEPISFTIEGHTNCKNEKKMNDPQHIKLSKARANSVKKASSPPPPCARTLRVHANEPATAARIVVFSPYHTAS